MSLGKRLREARTRKGLTQEDAAKHLGITFQALSNYERDIRDPDTDLLKNIADLYGVTTDYLLGRTNIPTPIETNEARNTTIKRVTQALSSDTELLDFWYELLERDDLQIMFKQVKDMPSDTVRRIIRYIKLVEEEEARE